MHRGDQGITKHQLSIPGMTDHSIGLGFESLSCIFFLRYFSHIGVSVSSVYVI